MANNEDVEIFLTPIQLAAIMDNETLEEADCLTSRIWGTVTLAASAVELIGAAALILTPEPTTVTKIAGGALSVHGLDTASSGIMQIVSCRTRTTLTSQAATAAAKALGVKDTSAASVGMAIDIAVPLTAGFVGAARILAIRRGSISLLVEEVAGGHTVARHVGRTEEQLRARLATQARIPAATTFRTLKDAERFIGQTLRAHKKAIKTWAKSANVGQTKGFTYEAGKMVGEGVLRSTGKLQKMSKLIVVVRKVKEQNRIYFILTAYPKI